MRHIVFAVFFMVFAGSATAEACTYKHPGFDRQLKAAKNAFIGTVMADPEGKPFFRIDKAIKGAEVEQATQFLLNKKSRGRCAADFKPGQIWLYMGNMKTDGTRLLADENGKGYDANILLAREKFGFETPVKDGLSYEGSVENSCAPWDGRAFHLELDNGLSAEVYQPLDSVRMATFLLGENRSGAGGGTISICGPAKQDCQSFDGRISVTYVDENQVRGQVVVDSADLKKAYPFTLQRKNNEAVCG
jgi:hypothetical protein